MLPNLFKIIYNWSQNHIKVKTGSSENRSYKLEELFSKENLIGGGWDPRRWKRKCMSIKGCK